MTQKYEVEREQAQRDIEIFLSGDDSRRTGEGRRCGGPRRRATSQVGEEQREQKMNIAYAEFSRSLHERHAGRRAPLEVSLEVTRRCPLECLHCYNNLPMGDLEARSAS